MTLISVDQNRGITKEISITKADGTTLTPGENDKIRAIITRLGKTAELTIESGSPTDNGSSFTKNQDADGNSENGTNTLVLNSADLKAIKAGIYSLVLDLFDNASGEYKTIDEQVIHIEPR